MQNINFIEIKYNSSYDPVTVDMYLSKSNKGTYFLKYNKKIYGDMKGNAEISKEDSKKIDNILVNSKIPIIIEGHEGLDGYTVEITLKSSGNELTYR